MKHILSIIICSTFILNAQVYIFSENIRITNTSNDQKFPQMAIDDHIIHLTWVSVTGNNLSCNGANDGHDIVRHNIYFLSKRILKDEWILLDNKYIDELNSEISPSE